MRGVRAARLVPLVEVGQLDPQQSRLKAVEALVVADLDVLALGPLAEVAQPAQPGREHIVVGADRTAVAERSEVLARVERECGGRAERPDAAPAIARPVRLSRVLEHEQTGRLGERVERADVTCLAIEVNGEDRRGARADGGASGVGIDQAGPVDAPRTAPASPPRARPQAPRR